MSRTAVVLASLLLVMGSTACNSTGGSAAGGREHPFESLVQLYLDSAEPIAREFVLPQSEIQVDVHPVPALTTADMKTFATTSLELGKGIAIEVTSEAARRLADAAAEGRRGVLVIDGRAVGMVRLSGDFSNQRLELFVELPESELMELVEKLNDMGVGRRTRTR